MMFEPKDIIPGLRVSNKDRTFIIRICVMPGGAGFVPLIEGTWQIWPMPISAQGVSEVLNENNMVIYEH